MEFDERHFVVLAIWGLGGFLLWRMLTSKGSDAAMIPIAVTGVRG